ncbi:Transmembrane protein 9 [Trichoplax sp. H2]|uniref:Transmembrane protein 9 n=1 Tax=Trichoplax adhaerens TaxID=10228 RepID=B3RRN8_TRIAD|nr:expressed hypothetical protein [Trichoplax adhaerens]EDV26384.1 expressed hypothetical protein [Trichoplax adhaerens]RDD38183.1 Transmembrane protein 9 [Trichoplax sp. H2]|eukprot:XP_002110380.1 expressed hypothetical protein [Trichoplax adhaerens]
MNYAFLFCLIALLIKLSAGQFSNSRCICVCPKDTEYTKIRNVFIKVVESTQNCTCSKAVGLPDIFCLRCQCKFQTRNMGINQGVVIFVLVVLALLLLYLTYSIYEKYARKELPRNSQMQNQQNLNTESISNRIIRFRTNWKKQLTEQQNNIYVRHNMLS